ncbi:MAG: class I SAM-dependent methyltransferase [Bryobacteraceae bacterium]
MPSHATTPELGFTTVPRLQNLIGYFQTQNLCVDRTLFRERLEAYLANQVEVPEHIAEQISLRPSTQSFIWGHDHDFGSFRLSGLMGTRHIWMLSRFFDHFGVSADGLRGQRVLDVGCWTGGVSLILERLGAIVTGIDEVGKYPHALNFLRDAFGLRSLAALHRSLYDLTGPEFVESFDTVFCLGVIYHVSDPVIALRRLF